MRSFNEFYVLQSAASNVSLWVISISLCYNNFNYYFLIRTPFLKQQLHLLLFHQNKPLQLLLYLWTLQLLKLILKRLGLLQIHKQLSLRTLPPWLHPQVVVALQLRYVIIGITLTNHEYD